MNPNLTSLSPARGRAWGWLLALALLLGGSAPAWAGFGLYKDFVIVNTNGNTNYYDTNVNTPNFDLGKGAANATDLGSYDRSTGTLRLAGAEANTFNDNGDNVTTARLRYRIYLQGATGGTFAALTLPFTVGGRDGSGNNKQWAITTGNTNLLAFTNQAGTYLVETYFEADANLGGGGTQTATEDNGGTRYFGRFTVSGTFPSATAWTGLVSNSWFDNGNWSNGVPTATTDASIPARARANDPPFFYPEINNPAAVASARDLVIEGTGTNSRGILRLSNGEVKVYGAFDDQAAGLIHNAGVFTLAGVNQTLTAGLFATLRIDGGGVKSISQRVQIATELNFVSGILTTRTTDPNTFSVDLNGNARITGENNTSLVVGITRVDRALTRGVPEDFGNIGVTVTTSAASASDPGTTFVTRTTGISGNNGVYYGVGSSQSVRRIYGIRPTGLNADGTSANRNLNATVTFRYRSVPEELNGNTESRLAVFQTSNSGSNFQNRGGALDQTAKTITVAGIQSLNTFTFAGRDNPLPVGLTAFGARRDGPGALLTWTTADEHNNRGFELQVSADGKAFRVLGFVEASSPSSAAPRYYRFRDPETNLAGTRYYRLRQVDLDGKSAFYGVVPVAFGSASSSASDAVAATLAAYPNPFAETLQLALPAGLAGTATVRISDLMGRTVREQTLALAEGTNNLTLNTTDLPAGSYLVRTLLPQGGGQTVRVQKL